MIERLRGRARQAQRKRIIERDKGLCQVCLKNGLIRAGTEVDHKIALQNGGDNSDGNQWLLCDDCHSDKTFDERPGGVRKRIGVDGFPVWDSILDEGERGEGSVSGGVVAEPDRKSVV